MRDDFTVSLPVCGIYVSSGAASSVSQGVVSGGGWVELGLSSPATQRKAMINYNEDNASGSPMLISHNMSISFQYSTMFLLSYTFSGFRVRNSDS